MSILTIEKTDTWWKQLRPRLTLIYLLVGIVLLGMGITGQVRLLSEIGSTFGGFFWAIDSTDGQIVIVSTPAQLPPLPTSADSLTSNNSIVTIDGEHGSQALTNVYRHAHPGDSITYTLQHNDTVQTFQRSAVIFTLEMWWGNYGLALLAGFSWLVVGGILLATAKDWSGAVEGLTLLPPAMLFLLYSHWGNVQQAYQADAVFQLLWVPSFALLGAAFIHLSLTYRPEVLSLGRRPRMVVDGLPYLPLVALIAYEWASFLLLGHVPTRVNLTASLGYGVVGGAVSFCIGLNSLVRVGGFFPFGKRTQTRSSIPSHVRRRIADLLTLWIGGVGLGFCLGILPILLTGQTLLPLSIFYVLATVYPLLLAYAIRSLRLVDTLQVTLEQREEALYQQEKTANELLHTNEELQQTTSLLLQTNEELQQATSLLLHADAHLRSLLSQRIHDQPKQQALRIRALLGHWQHKLRVEAEQDPEQKVAVQPIIEALGKVRKISEELESDLRGLQLLVEDAYQRRSLGLKLHLEKLIREDLPALHPESALQIQADLWALDTLSPNLEQSAEGARIAEAISYAVTQALLNVYNHSGATFATVRTKRLNDTLEVSVSDDGRGFDSENIPPEKTSLFKARLKVREAGGTLMLHSTPRPQPEHGTHVTLRVPLPPSTQEQPIITIDETKVPNL